MFSGLIKDQKLVFAFTILVISIFIFLTTVVIVAYMLFSENKYVPFFLRPFIDYHVHFMLIMSIVGVFSGFSFYFLISYTLKKEKSLIKKTIELVRKFLSDDEKRVIDALLEKQGLITQSDVSRLFGFSRVKTHRVIKRLEKRGIVYIDKQGKINYVRLVNTFLESEP
ncbi:MAG: winged helix-turn-helix transcriptional regulator [Candidatus Micrarchaeota archaeon]|nr:winged helix-turn-helix transcriptional regulator [Candidatus Micrarchaeota archaeon]